MPDAQHIAIWKSHDCVQATNGVVLATEKKLRSTLIDESTVKKISVVSPNIGLAYSGMGPDSRLLVRRARKQAQVCNSTLKHPFCMGFALQHCHAALICLPANVQCHGRRSHVGMRFSCDILEVASRVTVAYTICRPTTGYTRSTSLLRSSAGRWLP